MQNFCSGEGYPGYTPENLHRAAALRGLGKDAKLSSAHKKRARRLSLLRHAQHLLIEDDMRGRRSGSRHRTRVCCAARQHGANAITIRLNPDGDESSASLAGLQTCGSVWACPFCAPRIAAARGNEIKRALEWADANKYIAVMMTLTARHHALMPLQGFKDAFRQAYKFFISGRPWARIRRDYQIDHSISSREVLRGDNGWHYHMHVLLFVPRKAFAGRDLDLESDTRARWLKALHREGLDGIGEYALEISAHGNVPVYYLAKMGLSDRDTSKLDYELAGGVNKGGLSGVNVWSLLQRAQNGDEVSARLYLEYVRAMDGDTWIKWSDGFKAVVGVEDIPDDEITDESDDDTQTDWLTISDVDFAPVRVFQAQEEIINIAAATRSPDAVRRLLSELRDELLTALNSQAKCHGFESHYPLTKKTEAASSDGGSAFFAFSQPPNPPDRHIFDRVRRLHRDISTAHANLAFSNRNVRDAALKAHYQTTFRARIDAARTELNLLQPALERLEHRIVRGDDD